MIHGSAHKRYYIRIVIGGVCIAVVIYGLVMGINSVFSLQSVEVVGTEITIEINKKLLHANLLFIPIDQLRKQILKDYVLVSDVEIQKKYPHTIRIIPQLRLPIARLRTNARIVLVDKDGWVTGDEQNPANLPIMEFDIGEVYAGMQLRDARVISSLSFLVHIPDDVRVKRITTLDNASLRVISDRIDIYIPQSGDMEKAAATLQMLRTGFRIKGKLPAIVDLRFDKPVVTF